MYVLITAQSRVVNSVFLPRVVNAFSYRKGDLKSCNGIIVFLLQLEWFPVFLSFLQVIQNINNKLKENAR